VNPKLKISFLSINKVQALSDLLVPSLLDK